MSADDVSEVLIYVGRRTGTRGKLVYGYRHTDGKLSYYSAALIPAQIGTLVELTHPDGQSTTYYSKGPDGPKLVGFADFVEAADLTVWQVADRAAYQAKADLDSIKRAAKRAAGMESHIDALTEAARNLSSVERAAFGRYVSDRVRGL